MFRGNEDGGVLGLEGMAAVELGKGLSGENIRPWGKRILGGPVGECRVYWKVEGGRRDRPGCVSHREAF